MTGLVTCSVCGLVETGAAAGMVGPGCPRCGSRAVEFIELTDPVSQKRLRPSLEDELIERLTLNHEGIDYSGYAWHGLTRPAAVENGGAHVPMTRAA